MENAFFHNGGTPDLFLIGCCLISVVSAAVVILKRRSVNRSVRR